MHRYLFPVGVDRSGALIPQSHDITTAAAVVAASAKGDPEGEEMLGAASEAFGNQPLLQVCSNGVCDVYETGQYHDDCRDTEQLHEESADDRDKGSDKQLEGLTGEMGNTAESVGHQD